jgi:hypothetical protein
VMTMMSSVTRVTRSGDVRCDDSLITMMSSRNEIRDAVHVL